jgi:hypothetical protein
MGIFGFGKSHEKSAAEQHPVEAAQAGQAGTEPAVESSPLPWGLRELEPPAPYRDSEEHLWHALAWADALVRAQTLRWRRTIAASKSEHYWGMVHVTDAEVDALLHAPFMRPDELPESLAEALRPYCEAASLIAAHIDQRRRVTPPGRRLRLVELECLFGLSSVDAALLLVCLLPELDGRYRRLFGYLQDDASRTRPSVELALQILQPVAPAEAVRAALNAAAPLRARHLLHVTDAQGANDPLPARALHVDARVVDFLLGGDRLDGRLSGVVAEAGQPWDLGSLIAEPDLLARLGVLAGWLAGPPEEGFPAFFLHGAYGSGKRDAAAALSAAAGLPLLVADTRAALRGLEPWPLAVDLALREALLRGAALYWADTQILREPERPKEDWEYLAAAVEAHPGLVFFASDKPWDPVGRYRLKPFLRIDFAAPGYGLRRRFWEALLPKASQFAAPAPARIHLASILANGFQLTGGQIADAVATARAEAMQRDPVRPRLTLEDLYAGCRRQSSRGLSAFARLTEPRAGLGFEDLVLPKANRRQLDELRSRIRYRSEVYTGMGFERRLSLGKGLVALFTGSSGTGKTMAAELIGCEQGMQLFKIDLAAVVSKYVGETEKNLSRVFNEAEDANAILLFDEGETLFGKRGEIKEARDRWANNEAAFLLQRIEEYRGVVIITTNFRQNMDAAFLRRIQVSVDFPRPDAEARLRIWDGMFPPGVSRPGEAALRPLAEKFTLSGGNIKNVVLDAAFRALAEAGPAGPEITVRHLVLGIAREEQKMGRALTKGDFGEEYYAWVAGEILAGGQG